MFHKNDQHRQKPMFTTLDDLPAKQRERLESSWAATFYHEVFCRIDESIFIVLYSSVASRPNIPVNVLVGLEILKAGFGWSDAELEAQMAFNLQVRYALGYHHLADGHFELRTLYNFRQRLAQHMQSNGENLFDKVFVQITDAQIEKLQLKTGKLRMDSTQIASNIRHMTRVELLVQVLRRVWRMLTPDDRQHYQVDFADYLAHQTAHKYTLSIEPGQLPARLEAIGHMMRRLVDELADSYGKQATYQILTRVYQEHFTVVESELRPKTGQELSASSLQSPDDQEATYRRKNGKEYQGYVTNVTETCDPSNQVQLIVNVQTASNTVDDAVLLAEAIPGLVERSDLAELYTDGGYNSPGVDGQLQKHKITQYQTGIRGRPTKAETIGQSEFSFTRDEQGVPQTITCPNGQTGEVVAGRETDRFIARFDAGICAGCPLLKQCPTTALKRKPQYRVLRFNQQVVNVAHRRENQRRAKASGQNLRSAVEATVRSIKHPFGNHKLPVRGHIRVSFMMVASAIMVNARRIWNYELSEDKVKPAHYQENDAQKPAFSLIFCPVWHIFPRWQRLQWPYRAVAA